MRRVSLAVIAAMACALGAVSGAGQASAATRPVVVYEASFTSQHGVAKVRPSSWYLTVGPSTEFRGSHWSSWGGSAAAGTAEMYVIDFGTHDEGRAKVRLYDVQTYDGTRFFSKIRVAGAKTEDGVWSWCPSYGAWQSVC